jgi:predicted small lipoprotein YifL
MIEARRLIVAVSVVLAMTACGGDGPLARVDDDSGWDTATHAGETLATIGEDLLRAGKTCGHGPHCDDLLSASGWAQVAAVRILRCTRPTVFDTRTRTRALLKALNAHNHPRITLPEVPRC